MKKVLFVDDESELLKMYKILFESDAYCVLTADCISDAVEMIRNDKDIKLIFSDMSMPGGGGNFIEKVLLDMMAHNQEVPKIALISGHKQAETGRLFVKTFLKPIDFDDVEALIVSVLMGCK